MRYDTILFDLDGTLTDSAEGIINSIVHALKHYGLPHDDRVALRRFVGPPLPEAFERYCGFSPEKAKEAVAVFREYFSEIGIFENTVYKGVPKMLETLQAAGFTLAVATSKPEEYAAQILRHFDLCRYFDVVAGASMDEVRNKKSDVIAYALQKAGVEEHSRAVMVGDREHDVNGAHANGLCAVGVLWGYGDRAELEAAGAEHIVCDMQELSRLLLCEVGV